jgi:hypothetical protein
MCDIHPDIVVVKSEIPPACDPKSPAYKDFSWICERIENDSDTGIIFFSSCPSFEWTNDNIEITKSIKKIYVYDPSNVWWHGYYPGLPTYGCIALAKCLKKHLKKHKIKKLITMGASRGGYGAILFGCLLDADLVLSFSPQTSIDSKLNNKYGIFTRMEYLKKHKNVNFDLSAFDLKNVLNHYRKTSKTKYMLFYGSNNSYDKKSVKNIENFPNVHLIECESDSHKITKNFIQDGTIEKEIKKIKGA